MARVLRRGAVLGGSAVVLGAGYVGATDRDAREAVSAAVANNALDGLSRFGRTCVNAFATAVDYKVSLFWQDKERDREAYKEALRGANLRAAKRLFKVCHENGGLYTKFGQGVANLNHVLPPEFTDILAPLHDRAREMDSEMAMEAIKEELRVDDLSIVFESIEPRPIAAASLAQVHRAALKESGELVAVKIQYPYLKNQTKGDLATLRLLTDFVGYWFPDFAYSWLTPEFEDNMVLELDFIQEGRNGERLARMFASRTDVYVPKIKWNYTTERMLVMEFIEGVKITNVDAIKSQGIEPMEVATTVSSIFGDMIHVHGFAHCDPHPGNLLVRPGSAQSYTPSTGFLVSLGLVAAGSAAIPILGVDGLSSAAAMVSLGGMGSYFTSDNNAETYGKNRGNSYQVVVLDHGMYRRLEPSFRRSYCMLWKALLLRDERLGKEAVKGLGVSSEAYDALALVFTFRGTNSKGKLGQRLSKEERLKLREKYKDVSPGDVNKFLESLPRDLLFVLRCTNIVRSINLSLGGTSRLRFRIMGESAVRGLEVQNPPQIIFDEMARANTVLPTNGAFRINLPVASEIVDVNFVTPKQRFEMWRLRTYLMLIDSSWSLFAKIIQML